MKYVYLDLSLFPNDDLLVQGITSFSKYHRGITFYCKGDGLTYQTLDDARNVIRRGKFTAEDLERIDFEIESYEGFENFKRASEDTYFRLLDDPTQKKKLYWFFDETRPERYEGEITLVKGFYGRWISAQNPKIAAIRPYHSNSQLEKQLESEESFMGYLSLSEIFKNQGDIILMDNEVAFYVFSLLSTYSRFNRRERSVKDYAAFFAPFSFHKIEPKQMTLEAYFSYSLFASTKKEKTKIYLYKDMSPAEYIDFFKTLEALEAKSE